MGTTTEQLQQAVFECLRAMSQAANRLSVAISERQIAKIRHENSLLHAGFVDIRRWTERQEASGVAQLADTAAFLGDQEKTQALITVEEFTRAMKRMVPRLEDPAVPMNVKQETAEVLKTYMEMGRCWAAVQAAQLAYRSWTETELPPDEELIGRAGGAAYLADKLLEPSLVRDRDVIVLIGSGSRALVDELVRRGAHRVIVFIPAASPDENLHTKAVKVRGIIELKESLHCFGSLPPRQGTVRALPGVDAELLDECRTATEDALEVVEVSLNTLEQFGYVWARQAIQNMADVATNPPISVLAGAFAGKPAILVNPGPSLEKNLHLLKGMEDKAVIIAGTRVLRSLYKEGITPHFTVVVDPQPIMFHLDGLPVENLPAWVLGVSSAPEFFEMPKRRTYTFNGNGGLDGWVFDVLGERGKLATGGSVSTAALSLAQHMGCDPIILVGQDLAYTGHRVYASTAADGATRYNPEAENHFTDNNLEWHKHRPGMYTNLVPYRHRTLMCESWDRTGEEPTAFPLFMIRKWFEGVALEVAGATRLINATEGGAFIEGYEHIPLAEALRRHVGARVDVEACLDSVNHSVDFEERSRRMQVVIRQMMQTIAACQKQARICDDLALRSADDSALLDALDVEEKKLSKMLEPVAFIQLVDQKRIRQAIEQADRALNLGENLEAARAVFSVVDKGASSMQEPFARQLAKLSSVVEEQQEYPQSSQEIVL